MKNLFNDISQDERNRILEMHQSATKKNYLSEQGDVSGGGAADPNQDKLKKIQTSEEELTKFIQVDQNYVQSLFPKLPINTKEEWDSIKYPLHQILTWYAKNGKNPSTTVLSSIVPSIGGDFPQRYQIMINGDKSSTGRGFVADATTLNKQIISLYNNQLTKI
jgi:hypothetical protein